MAEWSRVVNTTIHEFVREEEVNILRNRKLLALLKERGRISFNHSGDLLDWKVRFKRAPLQGYADADTLTFSRRDRWKTAQLDWRGYATTDSMTKKEKLMNKSVEAIIDLYEGLTERLMDDIEDQFGDELYVDGNAAGNGRRMHGIESFLSSGGTTGVMVGDNNDTYANLVTTLGNYGGAWTGNWPTGTGDAHYDFWTPVLVDYTDAAFAAATDNWANNCVEAMRFLLIKTNRNKSKKGQMDLILLNDEMYRLWLAAMDTKERIVVTRGKEAGGLQTLGFTDVQNFDGCDVTWEYGIPSATGYGFNVDQMELCSLQDQLFVPEGPDPDIASKSYRFSIDFFGNLKFNPRFFGKLFNYT